MLSLCCVICNGDIQHGNVMIICMFAFCDFASDLTFVDGVACGLRLPVNTSDISDLIM